MTIPADLTKVNFDSATDDPELARGEFADNVDKVNQLLAHFGLFSDASAGDGLTISATVASIDLATNSGLTFSGSKLLINLNGGLALSAGGLEVDIAGTTTEASVDKVNDWLLIEDVSSGLLKKINPSDINDVGGIEVFKSSGTFIQPTGVTEVMVICIGAGGGGGGADTVAPAGGGGGGGAYIKAQVTISGNETITVGTGGSGGPTTGDGSTGGNTTFGSKVTAIGGSGGGGPGLGLSKGDPGPGGSGSSTSGLLLLNMDGVDGDAGNSPVNTGGDGGLQGLASLSTGSHPNPNNGGAVNNNGGDGVNPGDGGGGGGNINSTGGAGAEGICIVIY